MTLQGALSISNVVPFLMSFDVSLTSTSRECDGCKQNSLRLLKLDTLVIDTTLFFSPEISLLTLQQAQAELKSFYESKVRQGYQFNFNTIIRRSDALKKKDCRTRAVLKDTKGRCTTDLHTRIHMLVNRSTRLKILSS